MKVTHTHIYRYGVTFLYFWPVLMFKKWVIETHKNQFNLDYDLWQIFTTEKNCSKIPLLEMDRQFICKFFQPLSLSLFEWASIF